MTDVHAVTISLNGVAKTYSAGFQTDVQFSAGWQSVLKTAYGRAEVRCGCRGVGPSRLAVKYYESDKFSLAKFSLTGGQHASNCQYYSATSLQPGAGTNGAGVIDVQADGSVKIRLEIGLIERGVGPERDALKQAPNRAASSSQSSMKLLGLLQHLWEEAGLTQWKPAFAGKRRASLVYWWLNNAADNVWAGKVKLVDQLLLAAFGTETRDAERNRVRTAAALLAKQRLLIIAPLATFTEERAEAMPRHFKIGGFHGMPIAFMQAGLWHNTVRRFPNALSAWRQGHATIAIAQVELRQGAKGIFSTVIDMALMSITPEYIPVESSYERIVADMLIAKQRSFAKPLRYNVESDQVLPDFVLTDTPTHIPMEVFGRSDAKYTERKLEKTAYYDRQYGKGGWWWWDATASGATTDLPSLPAPR